MVVKYPSLLPKKFGVDKVFNSRYSRIIAKVSSSVLTVMLNITPAYYIAMVFRAVASDGKVMPLTTLKQDKRSIG